MATETGASAPLELRTSMEDKTASAREVLDTLEEVRSRTLSLIEDLSDEQLSVPLLAIVNPPLWEIGHVAWFHEKWALRHLRGHDPIMRDGDALYDSAAVLHDTRWGLGLPSREETLAYMDRVLHEIAEGLPGERLNPEETYFHKLGILHEDMHAEAITYTRQTLAYAPPAFVGRGTAPAGAPCPGDVEVPGGEFVLGASEDLPFVFDNEKWGHPVTVAPFRIARAAVSNAEFAAFADDGGYDDSRWWSEDGWSWRQAADAAHPVYWQREAPGRWLERIFDRWLPLHPHLPVVHVNWHEAGAYCRWAGRRLPAEAEWEMAAAVEPAGGAASGEAAKRGFPWGDAPPDPDRGNLDWAAGGRVPVDALAAGDSAAGCRQMIGNVWEWTADAFHPYPGFVRDPYKEYSEPWFGDHKVLRGGCWTTRSHLIRNTWRNFYKPDRRDVWAGFRTCARD